MSDENLGSLGDAFVSIKADFAELKNNFAGAFGEIGKMLGELEGTGASVASGIAVAFSAVVGIGAAGAAAIAGITYEIVDLGEKGAKIEDVTRSFDGFAQGLGVAGGTALQNLRTGTAGLVDDFTLMKDTTKAMSAGLHLSADDFTLVGEAARILAKQTGGDTATAFQDVTNALDSGMTKALLKNYGVMTDVKGAGADLKATLRQLSEETTTGADIDAKRTAIMEALRQIVERTGNQSLDFGEKVAVAKVSFTNFTNQLEVAIAKSPAVNAALDAIEQGLATAFGQDSQQTIATIVQWVDKFAIFVAGAAETAVTGAKFIVQAWDGIKVLFDYLLAGLLAVSEGVSKVMATIAEVADHVPGMADRFKGLGAVFQANADLAEQQRQILLKSASDNLDSAAKHIAAFDGMHTSIENVRQKMIEAAAAGDVETESVKTLKGATIEAKDANEAHTKAVTDVRDKIKELAASLGDASRQHLSTMEVEKLHGGEIADLSLKAKEFGLTLPASVQAWADAITNSKVAEVALETMAQVKASVAKGFEDAAGAAKDSLSKLNANQKTLVDTAADVQAQIVAATQIGADNQLGIINARLQKEIEKLGPLPAVYADTYNTALAAVQAAQTAEKDAIDARVAAELQKIADTEYASTAARDAETKKVTDTATSQKAEIDAKFAHEQTKLGAVPTQYATAYGEATAALRTQAQLQRDVINQTYDTLELRLTNAGVLNKAQLDKRLHDEQTTLAQMLQYNAQYGDAVGYTQEEIAAQLAKVRAAQELTADGWHLLSLKLEDEIPAIAQALGQGIAGGHTMDAVGGAAQSIGTLFASTMAKTAGDKAAIAIGEALGQALGGNGNGEKIGSTIGLVAGFAIGGPLGAAIGSAAGGYIGGAIEDHINATQVALVGREIGTDMGGHISQALASSIQQVSDQLQKFDDTISTNTARHQAELLSLDKIIGEQGKIGAQNIGQWALAAENLGRLMAIGGQTGAQALSVLTTVISQLTAGVKGSVAGTHEWNTEFKNLIVNTAGWAEGAKAVEANWDALVKSAVDDTGLINKGLQEVIATEAAAGDTTASVTKFKHDAVTSAEKGIQDALSVTSTAYQAQQADIAKLADLTAQYAAATSDDQRNKLQAAIDKTNTDLVTQGAIVSTTQIHSQQAATAIAATVAGAIANEIAAGKSFIDAVRDQDGAIADLGDQLNATGYSGGAAFDFIQREMKLATGEVSGPALKAIEGYTAAEVGLANAGQLSADTFAGLANQVGETERALEAQGVARADVLPAMQKDLQTIWELQQQNHGALDAYTQGLVDEAVKQNLVGETHKTVSDQMLDALHSIAAAADKLVQVFTGLATGGIHPLGLEAQTTFGGIIKAADEAGSGIKNTFKDLHFSIPVDYDVSPPPGPPPSGDSAPAGGTAARRLDAGGLGIFGGASTRTAGGLSAAALSAVGGARGVGGVVHETPMPIIVDGRLLTMVTIRHMGEMTRLMGVPT